MTISGLVSLSAEQKRVVGLDDINGLKEVIRRGGEVDLRGGPGQSEAPFPLSCPWNILYIPPTFSTVVEIFVIETIWIEPH